MNRYDKERLVEIVLYVLNKTGELYYYTLLKTIYFAELKHLAKWGQRITSDDVCAMPYGPVLSHLLDAIKGDSHEPELSRMLKSAFKFASEDASNIMLPLRRAFRIWLSHKCRDLQKREAKILITANPNNTIRKMYYDFLIEQFQTLHSLDLYDLSAMYRKKGKKL